jgi:hypothetical protein
MNNQPRDFSMYLGIVRQICMRTGADQGVLTSCDATGLLSLQNHVLAAVDLAWNAGLKQNTRDTTRKRE